MAALALGQNVMTSVKGNILTIEVDLSKVGSSSKSGKSLTIATTGGNQTLPGYDKLVKVGVNVYLPN